MRKLPMTPDIQDTDFKEIPMCQPPVGGIGDVTSSAKGSGARYNTDKPPLELLPLRILAAYYAKVEEDCGSTDTQKAALKSLRALADWQERGEVDALLDALVALGNPLLEASHVFDYGRAKYAEWNWAKGMPWSVPLACAARHLVAILDGQDADPESTRLHSGHVACNLVMLLTYIRTYIEGDDRPRLLA